MRFWKNLILLFTLNSLFKKMFESPINGILFMNVLNNNKKNTNTE